ncbi:MAG: hypothetical protein QM305_14660 [Bacteroidota bacterium]|nr:hypothetical protein [Bacteroidota bacterium]
MKNQIEKGNQIEEVHQIMKGNQIEEEVKHNGRKYPFIPCLFGIAMLFFFFNFFVVSCDSKRIVSITGIDLVKGVQTNSKIKRALIGEDVIRGIWTIRLLATTALVLATVGLIVFIGKTKRKEKTGLIAGVAGSSLLLFIYFLLKITVKSKVLPIQLEAKLPFWGAVIAMGSAALLCHLKRERKRGHKNPSHLVKFRKLN